MSNVGGQPGGDDSSMMMMMVLLGVVACSCCASCLSMAVVSANESDGPEMLKFDGYWDTMESLGLPTGLLGDTGGGDPTTTAAPTTTKKDCVAFAKGECDGKKGSDRDKCITKFKKSCVADGGEWIAGKNTSTNDKKKDDKKKDDSWKGKDCVKYAQDKCKKEKGSDRNKCIGKYKERCMDKGGEWKGATRVSELKKEYIDPVSDALKKVAALQALQRKPKGTLCVRLFEDANYDGTQYPVYTAVDATKNDQVVLTVNDLKSTYGVKGLTSIVVEPGFGVNLYPKKYLDGEAGWVRGRINALKKNDQYQSMQVYYNANWL